MRLGGSRRGRSTARLLIDPGTYASGFEGVRDLDAVLVTHQHADHVDLGRLPALLKANPDARLIADAGTAGLLADAGLASRQVTGGDVVTTAATVTVAGADDAVIHPRLPNVANNGYLIQDLVFHPGDAFVPPPASAKILLLPTGGPWMKVGEAINYVHSVHPDVVVPIHEAGLAPAHQQLHYQLLRALSPAGTRVEVLEREVPQAF